MENVTLDRAVEVVRALGPEEQFQLRALMDSWQAQTPAEATPEQERKFAEHLLAKGMIAYIPTGERLDPDPEPIVVRGSRSRRRSSGKDVRWSPTWTLAGL